MMTHTAFLNSKNSFFNEKPQTMSLAYVETMLNKSDDNSPSGLPSPNVLSYSFLINNYKVGFEQEFDQLFSTLRTMMDKHSNDARMAWFYCFYCCRALKVFYQDYGKPDKVAALDAEEKIIGQFLDPNYRADEENPEALEHKKNSIWNNIKEYLKEFFTQAATARARIGFFNMCRVYWVFCRITVSGALTYMRDVNLLDHFEKLFHQAIYEKQFIRFMESANPVMNMLSVGFFAFKILIDAAHFVKHVWHPNHAAMEQSSWKERFSHELYKRHGSFLNDFAWASVNGLTNYAEFFSISVPLSNALVAGFLLFDVLLVVEQYIVKHREYSLKQKQYDIEIAEQHESIRAYQADIEQIKHKLVTLGGTAYLIKETDYRADWNKEQTLCREKEALLATAQFKLMLLNKQRDELKLKWKVKQYTSGFDILAGFIFLAGFSASIVFAAPLVAVAAYAFCVLAVAIYLSGNEFGAYQESRLRLNAAKNNDPNQVALKAYIAARNEFISSMLVKTLVPTVTIALFAICWEAALLAVVIAVAYQLYKHNVTNKKPTAAEEILPKTQGVWLFAAPPEYQEKDFIAIDPRATGDSALDKAPSPSPSAGNSLAVHKVSSSMSLFAASPANDSRPHSYEAMYAEDDDTEAQSKLVGARLANI